LPRREGGKRREGERERGREGERERWREGEREDLSSVRIFQVHVWTMSDSMGTDGNMPKKQEPKRVGRNIVQRSLSFSRDRELLVSTPTSQKKKSF
jgi:hypothetical protein